ncbi:MAG TPA: STAS domain-containing protein [Nitrospira sp.]|nr:STAS domain-containing protein [Nitrospira sp.]
MDQETRHTLMVTSHQNAGITVVNMKGSLAATTAEQGNKEMKRILDAGAKKVVLNLAEVDYISSGGIRVIMLTSKLLNAVQGEMKLSSAKGMVKEALQASGFDLLSRVYGANLQLCNTDEEAVASFKS